VPVEVRGCLSDGLQLADLLSGGRRVKARWLLGRLSSAMQDGARPRDWDQPTVQRLLAMRSGESYDSLSNLYGYYYSLDCGQVERAGELLDLAIAQRSGCPMPTREGIFVEAAYFEGRYRKNAVAARRWFDLLEAGKSEKHTLLRAEAAVLLTEGRIAEATSKAEDALKAVTLSKDPGGALAEADWLRGILAELNPESQAAEQSGRL